MTVSIPLLEESKPKLNKTILPSTPNKSLLKLGSTNGTSGMPCGIMSILSGGTS
ncbi:hypothetical protein ASZ90_003897 [hydrocarbon metagenome]|uniref:Uncharacterized protein n=1 Tax=hydrocarbon metagenome TaxID=938273 RepID=A0A0W8FZC6_9ZZZZ